MRIAAVKDVCCASFVGKAQFFGVRIVKDRVHLPAADVDLDAERRVQQRGVVDVLPQQLLDQIVVRAAVFVVVQRINVAIQLVLRQLGRIAVGVGLGDALGKMAAVAALRLHLLAEGVQPARRFLVGQRDLRRLEEGAGVGLVLFKPRQSGIGDQTAPDKGSQNRRDGQHHDQLHESEAVFRFCFVTMYHRYSRLYCMLCTDIV